MLVIKSKYETKANEYEIKGNIAYIKLRKKDGTSIDTKIDAEDLQAVLEKGTWFAEWNKDFNSYLVKALSSSSEGGKKIKEKITLQTFILGMNTRTPVRHLNGDTLDNRKSNITVYDQNAVVNDYEDVDNDSVYIILRDKYGRQNGRTLIDRKDLSRVINSFHTWVYYLHEGEHYAVANTKNGRVYLHNFIMDTPEDMVTKYITHNTMDNRRSNLKTVAVEKETEEVQP